MVPAIVYPGGRRRSTHATHRVVGDDEAVVALARVEVDEPREPGGAGTVRSSRRTGPEEPGELARWQVSLSAGGPRLRTRRPRRAARALTEFEAWGSTRSPPAPRRELARARETRR